MGGFHSVAYPLLLALSIGMPLLVLSTGSISLLTLMRGGSAQRRTAALSALGTAGFLMLDALLLKALPWLGLSFGPAGFTWITLFGLRAVLLTVWFIVLLMGSRRQALTGQYLPRLLPLWLVHALFTLLIVYSFYIEPFHIQVTRLQEPVPVSQLREPLRIMQISDLHVERTTPRERALIPLVQGLKPDVIFLTGDYLNVSYLNDPIALRDARAVINQLSAPYGVYAVNGSVDNTERMRALFSDTPVTILRDVVEKVKAPDSSIYIIGICDCDLLRDEYVLGELMPSVPEDAYRILLYHTPDLAIVADPQNIDLYMAGHTHGGQIRLPVYGAIVTASIHGKKYEAGPYRLGDSLMYVSRGLGMEGGQALRARFLTPPEVVVIDLVPTP